MIDNIYDGCRLFLNNNDYILNNVFIFDWESDLFAITKSEYSIEIEVKISRADFRADFKKKKHEWIESLMNGNAYFQHERRDFGGSNNSCSVGWKDLKQSIPNKFYFACPDGLISPEEVPSYAGLIHCGKNSYDYEVVKKAPILHRNKIDFKDKLLSKYYNTSLNTRQRITDLTYRIKRKPMCMTDVEKELKSILRLLK